MTLSLQHTLPHTLLQDLPDKLGLGPVQIHGQAVRPWHKQSHDQPLWEAQTSDGHHSPVVPAPAKLEVAQVMRKPVDESEDNTRNGHRREHLGSVGGAGGIVLPVYARGVHGVQSHVHHLCGLSQLTPCSGHLGEIIRYTLHKEPKLDSGAFFISRSSPVPRDLLCSHTSTIC